MKVRNWESGGKEGKVWKAMPLAKATQDEMVNVCETCNVHLHGQTSASVVTGLWIGYRVCLNVG
jgi:hypothetical protein